MAMSAATKPILLSASIEVIDCEIFAIDEVGIPTAHQKLGTRVHSKDKQKAVSDCPVQLVVFDCMSYMGNAQLSFPRSQLKNHLADTVMRRA